MQLKLLMGCKIQEPRTKKAPISNHKFQKSTKSKISNNYQISKITNFILLASIEI